MNCKVAQHLCYAVECRIIVYIRCSKKCWPNPCSDVGVLCLNELLDADGTDKLRWTIIEDKARKLVSSLGRVQEVPEEVLAAVVAAVGAGRAPSLSTEPGTTAACTLHLLQPCRQKMSNTADIQEKEVASNSYYNVWCVGFISRILLLIFCNLPAACGFLIRLERSS